jgi:two-component system nitrogen regulation response regulator GlnG
MKPVTDLPVLLVDDEPELLQSASVALRSAGFPQVATIDDSRTVAPFLAAHDVGVMVLDLTMAGISGHALLDQVGADHPDLPIIVMTATNDVDTAVHAMQAGAVDYLVKPVEQVRLASSVRRALEMRALRAEVLSLKDRLLTDTPHGREAFDEIVTRDRAMSAVFRYVEAIAPSPQPVLITGETGTGKELVARALHKLSQRPGDLVTVNAAGLDDTLFSDTLFGHTRGAYTGADRPRDGLLTTAVDGTLFLDEIGDLAIASQVKLLRLLQDGTYFPLGADQPRRSRARVIVATNADVAHSVAAGSFRKDLYYRLRTHHLQLPPLRERPGDLPLLVNHFVDSSARALNKTPPAIPPALYSLLKTYRFPGNVRELEAMVFDAVTRHEGSVLALHSFKEAIGVSASLSESEPAGASPPWEFPDQLPTLNEAEEALINEALTRADGNQGVAAGLLGISRQALNKRLNRRGGELHRAHQPAAPRKSLPEPSFGSRGRS